MIYNELTSAQKAVIENKGTEPPFTGEYVDFFKPGYYACARCDNPLYSSEAKFHSGCGWPSFDEAYAGAVKEILDADGSRKEIVCFVCGAHLGHVFRGEQATPKDTRYCVNSLSIKFVPEDNK